MYNFVRRGAYMLLIAGLTMGVAGCSDDDPDYDNVTPPVVEVASNTLTGVITSLSGEGISGAKVSLGRVILPRPMPTVFICLRMSRRVLTN